jgi:chromate transport protein ChrA
MSDIIKDIKYALGSMGTSIYNFFKEGIQIVGIISVCVAIICALVYYMINWPLQTITVIVIVAFTSWFLIELDTARWEREQNEKDISNGNKN